MIKNRQRTVFELLTVCGLLTLIAPACGPRDAELSELASPNPAPLPAIARVETPPVAPSPAAPEPIASESLALRFVSPNIGPAGGGNDVTIDGQGFADYPQITFGGAHAWIRSVSPTEIRVTVPAPIEPVAAGDTLTVDVAVINPPEGSRPIDQTLTRSYSYVSSAPPSSEPRSSEPRSSEPPERVAAAEPPATGTAPPAAATPRAAATSPAADAEPGPAAEAPSADPSGLIASFSFEMLKNSEECPTPGTAIRFTDRSSGATEWWWDFGDGETSKERNNNHCYSAPGMRSVSLTVSNDDGSASTSKIVTAGM